MFDVLSRIKELREARGWSVYHLAKRSGIPQSTIATWYQNNLYPPIDKIEILCQTFGISLTSSLRVKRFLRPARKSESSSINGRFSPPSKKRFFAA